MALNAVVVARTNELRVELYLSGSTAKQYYTDLLHDQGEIQGETNLNIEWINDEGKKRSKNHGL